MNQAYWHTSAIKTDMTFLGIVVEGRIEALFVPTHCYCTQGARHIRKFGGQKKLPIPG